MMKALEAALVEYSELCDELGDIDERLPTILLMILAELRKLNARPAPGPSHEVVLGDGREVLPADDLAGRFGRGR